MYPVGDKATQKELFLRRQTTDYSNKHDVEYVAPPVVKDVLKKNTFVHNCLANKSKSNVDHFKNIFNSKVLTA